MKICIEKAEGSYVTAMGKGLKPKCQVRSDNITDHSLNLIKYLEICSRGIRLDVVAIFNARVNGRSINMQVGFLREKLSSTHSEPTFLEENLAIDLI